MVPRDGNGHASANGKKAHGSNPTEDSREESATASLALSPSFAQQERSDQADAPKVEQGAQVFISHGRNKAVVEQLKELLTFGKFVPVVAVEQETTATPVPDKVFEAMRSCAAGVIHVEGEIELMDAEGIAHKRINDNVRIEIGAAIALYGRNFILLVRKGVELPSNLQGLYRCDYEGEKLDLDAAMKLLKTFNQFK